MIFVCNFDLSQYLCLCIRNAYFGVKPSSFCPFRYVFVMVLCPVVNSLRMLELLCQVCLVVVRSALLNLACWVRLSNYWICLLVWLFVSGLIVLVWSVLVQAVLFSLVWSVRARSFWSISFGLYCSVFFSPAPSWQVLVWFGFSYRPCCVGADLLSYVLLCSSPVYPFFFAFVWFIVLFRYALV